MSDPLLGSSGIYTCNCEDWRSRKVDSVKRYLATYMLATGDCLSLYISVQETNRSHFVPSCSVRQKI